MQLAMALMDWLGSVQGGVFWWLVFVVGGLAGGFLTGLTSQALVGVMARQRVPLPAVWLIRTGGGLLCGYLLALYLTGHGPGGLGGPGGWLGNSSGEQSAGRGTKPEQNDPARPSTPSESQSKPPLDNAKTNTPEESQPKPPPETLKTSPPKPGKASDSLVVEVLSDALAAELQKTSGPVTPERCYRVSTGADKVLMDLGGVCNLVREQTDPPIRRVKIILYNDSPAQGSPRPQSLYNALSRTTNSEGKKLEPPVESLEVTDAPR